ncbi:glycoside hydrolase family 3 C-terminal domain-containing protein [Maribellus sediminis]|uniref:glycoside hydrolase family 3 C-terminal domain-containing protein n=1 Tax=Maribellus sediminis TaxID=2696285 RepID=UPI00142F6814|nr:glycoside hydrolase family 3 C-terminal domain-containing protein [Maribellus sediminis]
MSIPIKYLTVITVFIFCCYSSLYAQSTKPIYLDANKPIEERIEDALSRMTVEEKIAMCHAQSKFSSPGVPRLGIPENWMTDGPHGIRTEVLWDEWKQAGWTNDSCIAFPALTCLAASWNKEIAALYGKSVGEEARYRKKNVLLGPGVNIYRTPLNGRNFEYMGEDPYLAGQMVVPYVKGVQSNGVAACVKHYALNNQETSRMEINVKVSDRALYEIYLPAYKAAVTEGNAWAIMGAYGKYRQQHACHNQYLLQDILRDEWHFDGVVISDWGGVHNTEQAIYNGLDMEFGTWTNGMTGGKSSAYNDYYLARPFYEKIKNGEVEEEVLNEKVRNILRLVFRTNMDTDRPWGSFGTPEHAAISRKIAEEGIVLLKNEKDLLPIDLDKTKKILVVGENAIKMMCVGGGSSSLKVKYEVPPFEGLKNRLENEVEVSYARGYVGHVDGNFDGVSSSQDLAEDRSEKELIDEACTMAGSVDIVIFIGGLNKSRGQDCEGADRKSLDLPYAQNRLIEALAKVNSNLVVVNISGNAVSMPWLDEVPTVMQSWYNGTEAGNALAAILTGDVNPSGKLPFTFNNNLNDYGAHFLNAYPGNDNEVEYKEDIYVGYRWNDKENIKPLFAFGYGLSYTTFEYSNLMANKTNLSKEDSLTISLDITNSGKVDGAEIVQLYIHDPESNLPRPEKELKGFEKVFLKSGETKTVQFTIDNAAQSYFDPEKHEWIAEPGRFEAWIGAASDDVRAKIKFDLD